MYAAARPAPGGIKRPHSAREAPGSAGCSAPASAALPTSTTSGTRFSTAANSPDTATANSAAATSNGRVGPSRSTHRPCTTDPSATPTSEAADTVPAVANDPVAPCT